MSALSYLDTGRFDVREIREENRLAHERANQQQTEMLLQAELEYQYELMNSPDPQVRAKALLEIERISTQLGA